MGDHARLRAGEQQVDISPQDLPRRHGLPVELLDQSGTVFGPRLGQLVSFEALGMVHRTGGGGDRHDPGAVSYCLADQCDSCSVESLDRDRAALEIAERHHRCGQRSQASDLVGQRHALVGRSAQLAPVVGQPLQLGGIDALPGVETQTAGRGELTRFSGEGCDRFGSGVVLGVDAGRRAPALHLEAGERVGGGASQELGAVLQDLAGPSNDAHRARSFVQVERNEGVR